MAAFMLGILLASSALQEPATESVSRFYREWSSAIQHGAAAYASFFATDGTLLPSDEPPVVGRAAIEAWFNRQASVPYRVQPESVNQDEIRIVGETAIVRTTLRGKRVAKADGRESVFEAKYLDVLRRTAAGRWEFVSRMWNSNLQG
jgi:uncharacterized protein (TIGR02246 family)